MVRAWVILTVITMGHGASPKEAQAQEVEALNVHAEVDGAITLGAAAGILLLGRVPVKASERWNSELLGALDSSVEENFSTSAASLSDAALATAIVTPLLLQVRDGFDAEAGRRVLLYSETIATSLFVNAAAKYAMQRPRPYVFNKSPKARAYAASQGDDAYLSFYSGHASTAFASAVAGATLFAQEDTSVAAKSTLWGVEMGLASATAMLRVRAGKHYYTDVLLGALVGSAMGMIVPALHSEGGLYSPSGSEWGSMAAGLGVGTFVGLLMPLPDEALNAEEGLPTTKATLLRSLQFAPLAHEGGGGMAVSASF